jgi:hypothetical protein
VDTKTSKEERKGANEDVKLGNIDGNVEEGRKGNRKTGFPALLNNFSSC